MTPNLRYSIIVKPLRHSSVLIITERQLWFWKPECDTFAVGLTNTVQHLGHQSKEEIPLLGTRIYNLNALVDTLEGNEHLRSLVLEAKLKWGRLLGEMNANKKAITRLMSLLTNLQTLQLLPGHVFFTHTPSAQIASLHIYMPRSETVSLHQLAPLLTNTYLRSLSMTTIQSWAWNAELSEGPVNPQDVTLISFISHLSVSSSVCSANTMETILHAPKALTSLHYRYSGHESPDRNAVMPSNFPTPLLPHQSSLEELVIYAQPHQHISKQHPSGDIMQTMRGFAALKRLGLPAWWIVHPTSGLRESQVAGASCSAKLVEMFPPKLEILQVQLEEVRLNCRNQVPFEHISRAENVIENYGTLLCWIGGIAVWKQDYVPALKEVIVWSSHPELPHEKRMLHRSGIEEAFLKQGVRIKFIVCRPESPMLFGINMES
jgi:hypothetical protein